MNKQISKTPGIYKIVNLENNKLYIGSTANLYQRKNTHWSYLRNNKHENQFLQNSWNKWGKNCFRFEVILLCSKKTLLVNEQRYLDQFYDNQINCYNICPTAGSCLGVKHTEETKQKKVLATSGKNNHFFGKQHTKEAKQKISKANKGRLTGNKNPMWGKIGKLHPFYGKTGEKHPTSKAVFQINFSGKILNTFPSIRQAAIKTNIDNTVIIRCCKGKQKTAGGFIWKYVNSNQ